VVYFVFDIIEELIKIFYILRKVWWY